MVNNALIDKLFNSQDWETSFGSFLSSLEPNDLAGVWTAENGGLLFNLSPQAGHKPIQGRKVADWEAEIGKLYSQAAQEFDEAKRKAIYAETQRLAQEYLPCIYLINRLEMMAVRDGTKCPPSAIASKASNTPPNTPPLLTNFGTFMKSKSHNKASRLGF
ncbi:hypothetical protein NIES2130_10870 [Scytonema sp. HK-05]|nr:hypothetical protein NIES2130_10870 [Scytonema sp. HK-05]